MKKYVLYIILTALVIASFFISGLFFINSGMIDFQDGELDEDRGVQILAELDKLPMIRIDVYEINFHSYGEITEIGNESISLFSFHKDEETFFHDMDLTEFNEEERVMVYYNYLPEGGKNIIKIRRID